jgi:hypothetical protein
VQVPKPSIGNRLALLFFAVFLVMMIAFGVFFIAVSIGDPRVEPSGAWAAGGLIIAISGAGLWRLVRRTDLKPLTRIAPPLIIGMAVAVPFVIDYRDGASAILRILGLGVLGVATLIRQSKKRPAKTATDAKLESE